MSKIIYGMDTGSIEDFGQCVLVRVPEEAEEDSTLLEDLLQSGRFQRQGLVGDKDVAESLQLILRAEEPPLSEEQIGRILASLTDAISNNYEE